jgi:hypothetical protein
LKPSKARSSRWASSVKRVSFIPGLPACVRARVVTIESRLVPDHGVGNPSLDP